MANWKPVDLPQPGSDAYNTRLAETLAAYKDGKVTACPPAASCIDHWTFWQDGDDITGWIEELVDGGHLTGPDPRTLAITVDGREWLAEVTGARAAGCCGGMWCRCPVSTPCPQRRPAA